MVFTEIAFNFWAFRVEKKYFFLSSPLVFYLFGDGLSKKRYTNY